MTLNRPPSDYERGYNSGYIRGRRLKTITPMEVRDFIAEVGELYLKYYGVNDRKQISWQVFNNRLKEARNRLMSSSNTKQRLLEVQKIPASEQHITTENNPIKTEPGEHRRD